MAIVSTGLAIDWQDEDDSGEQGSQHLVTSSQSVVVDLATVYRGYWEMSRAIGKCLQLVDVDVCTASGSGVAGADPDCGASCGVGSSKGFGLTAVEMDGGSGSGQGVVQV